MEDEPTHRVMRRLRELHYGQKLGRSTYGTEQGIEAITQDDVREFYTTNYHAGGGILAVAGNVDVATVMKWATSAFGDWKTGPDASTRSTRRQIHLRAH